MKKHIRVAVSILMLTVFLSVEFAIASEWEMAPDFSLPDINNNIVTLSSYKDKKPVLLFFWTTWCPYCRSELRALNNKYPALTKEGLEVLPINVGESRNRVKNFIQNYYLTYPVILDENMEVAYNYGIPGVPAYILIDKKGKVVFEGSRFPEGRYKDLISK